MGLRGTQLTGSINYTLVRNGTWKDSFAPHRWAEPPPSHRANERRGPYEQCQVCHRTARIAWSEKWTMRVLPRHQEERSGLTWPESQGCLAAIFWRMYPTCLAHSVFEFFFMPNVCMRPVFNLCLLGKLELYLYNFKMLLFQRWLIATIVAILYVDRRGSS
jgi:hypothetical protein